MSPLSQRVTAAALLVCVTASTAYACFVAQNKPCCDALPPSAAYPRPNDPCPDQITSNPSISHFTDAGNGQSGRKTRISQSPGQDCVWDDYEFNSLGHCVVQVEDLKETCTPVVLGGATCTGGAPQ